MTDAPRASLGPPGSIVPVSEARISGMRPSLPDFASRSDHPLVISDAPPAGSEAESEAGKAAGSAAWLERLLVLSCALPVEEGEAAVARALAMALSEWLDLPVGVCLVSEGGGQEVVRVLPGGDAQGGVIEPARLFPSLAVERVFVVPTDASSGGGETTLHFAADAPELESTFVHLGQHAAMVLGSELAAARRHLEGRRSARELAKLQGYIIQADKLASMGQLAAGVVHELNNPLTSIVAYTEYLLRKATANPAGDVDDLERLRRIGESAGRMLRLTRDLVTYARPSSDIAVPVAVDQVIEKALAFCEHVLGEAGARVERHFAERLPPVRGMPEELAQVFVNLLTNACHAVTGSEGVLIVTTSLETDEPGRAVRTTLRSDREPDASGALPSSNDLDGAAVSSPDVPRPARSAASMPQAGGGIPVNAPTSWVQVTVEDNGHGIDEQHLPHIFAPFFTTKGEGRGTGLGLAIVKNIMDKHVGSIHAEASHTGGTRFVLRFPALEF